MEHDDANVLIEAHICAGAKGVRMEINDASPEDVNEYFVFACGQGDEALLKELLERTDATVWVEGLTQALSQQHWLIVEDLEREISLSHAGLIKKAFPNLWASAALRHDQQALRWLEKYEPTVLNYKEAALHAVRGPKPELLKWALDGWREKAAANDRFLPTVFSDAVRQQKGEMIKIVLPYVSSTEIDKWVTMSATDPNMFGPQSHSVLEKAVLEWNLSTVSAPSARRKI